MFPFTDRLFDGLCERDGCRAWFHECVGIACAYEYVGFDKYDGFAMQAKFCWRKYVAYACCEYRGVVDEERAVGSYLYCVVLHLLRSESECKLFVEHLDDCCCIGRTSSESCPYRYVFVKVDFLRREVEVFAQKLVCFYDKVVIGCAVEDCSADFQFVSALRLFAFNGLDFNCVLEINRIKYAFYVVVTVRTAFGNAESDVYFCVRIGDHMSCDL